MRLLSFNDSGRLVLTDFTGRTVPPYAILSHRWGESEVAFEDLAVEGKETYKRKQGYRKIQFCATQAARDELCYFWIDTCCIDKWNRRELSKAINSMFNWYKESTRCYVFLSDVSTEPATELHGQRDWEASFRASEWFTRGWALQELIAPTFCEFFTVSGYKIGNKRTLMQMIHEITSVPIEALQNHRLDKFQPSARIAWARNRVTTEPEDNAYCLLGILDVSMPISYGEGKEKAMKRLYNELQATGDVHFVVPFAQNELFLGRDIQLEQLESKFFQVSQASKMALVGPGGTGKSQIALEFAHRAREKHDRCSIFWVDASDIDSLQDSYSTIAQKLRIPGWNDENTDIKQLVKDTLGKETAKKSLVIYDNVEDLCMSPNPLSSSQTANLVDFLPQSQTISFLFTTKDDSIAKYLATENIMGLEDMSPATARKMFENHLIIPIAEIDQTDISVLLEELSHLPMAIVHAAAYLNNVRDATIQTYTSQIMRQKQQALGLDIPLFGSDIQDSKEAGLISASLFLSVEEIHRNHTQAAKQLCLAACVDRKDIPINFLKATSDSLDSIGILTRFGLVTKRPAESSLYLHQLVHNSLRKWLQRRKILDSWNQTTISRLAEIFPNDEPENRSKWRRLLPHTKYALANSSEQYNLDKALLMWKCAMALTEDARYDEAEELFMRVIATRKALLGDYHEDTLFSRDNLALTYWYQGRRQEAGDLEAEVAKISQRELGEDHPNTLTSMSNLALIYNDLGRKEEAEQLALKVLERRKGLLGEEHQDVLLTMINIGVMYWDQRRLEEAEQIDIKVLEISRRVLGDDYDHTVTAMSNLISIYAFQGRLDEAEELGLKALESRKRMLGDEHPDTLTTMVNLAACIGSKDVSTRRLRC